MTPLVADVRFHKAPAHLAARGVQGWVEFTYGALRIDGVSVRLTREGVLTLSFPEIVSKGKRRRPVRPLNTGALRELEDSVFRTLDLDAAKERP